MNQSTSQNNVSFVALRTLVTCVICIVQLRTVSSATQELAEILSPTAVELFSLVGMGGSGLFVGSAFALMTGKKRLHGWLRYVPGLVLGVSSALVFLLFSLRGIWLIAEQIGINIFTVGNMILLMLLWSCIVGGIVVGDAVVMWGMTRFRRRSSRKAIEPSEPPASEEAPALASEFVKTEAMPALPQKPLPKTVLMPRIVVNERRSS